MMMSASSDDFLARLTKDYTEIDYQEWVCDVDDEQNIGTYADVPMISNKGE
jgi:hypothetical protein